MGKLIVLEGLDGSGKSTQLSLLEEALTRRGYKFKTVSFPEYSLPSCEPVKMYLAGEFGTKPNDVNAYAASLFYAVDRFASFKKEWCDFYNNGGLILAGRYTTSNAIHQTSKLDKNEWESYLSWLEDLEYDKMGIPKPDKVIFLNVPIEVSQKLLSDRYEGNESKKDIHERDISYLMHCHEAADFAISKFGWDKIECYEQEKMRTRQSISEEILAKVLPIIK
ncbi:MAG: thymidylate kinase [Acutalibacteraceae bacterium]|nr:thymidylate kinase [Acutalibacteraceae bacterium]